MNNKSIKTCVYAEFETASYDDSIKINKRKIDISNKKLFCITEEELLNIIISRDTSKIKLPNGLDNNGLTFLDILVWINKTLNIDYYLLFSCTLFKIQFPGISLVLISDKNNVNFDDYRLIWEF